MTPEHWRHIERLNHYSLAYENAQIKERVAKCLPVYREVQARFAEGTMKRDDRA
jgi:hypothetical protein